MPSIHGHSSYSTRKAISFWRLVVCGALLLAAACASGPAGRDEADWENERVRAAAPPAPVLSRSVQDPLDLGQAMLLRRRFNEAQVYFKKALDAAQHPLGQAKANIGMATAALAQGRLTAAKDWLKHAAAMEKAGAEVLQADWLEAKIMSKQGDKAAMAEALRRFAMRPMLGIPLDEQANAAFYLDSQMALGQGDSALLNALLYSARRPGSLAARDLPPWIALTAAQLPASYVASLVKVEPDEDLRAALIAGLTRGYLQAGDVAEAKQATNYLAALPQGGRWRAWVQAMREDLSRGPAVMHRAIGAVLPLSGPQAMKGQRVLLAIKLALGVIQEPDKALALHAVDSKSQALAADQAVKELVERHKVAMIIGPLDSLAAMAAARRAQSLETPILCLNGNDELAKVGQFVFRNYPVPADQVAAVMPKVSEEGSTQVAMLAPDNTHGHAFVQALQAWLDLQRTSQSKTYVLTAGRGMELMPPVFYRPGGGAWRSGLDRLVKLPPANQGQGVARRPVINFDRLWLPGPVEEVEVLVSRLLHFGVRGKQLLGTFKWYDPKLLAKAGKLLEGAMFASPFDPVSSRETVRVFIKSFQNESAHEPGLLDALGYDAALAAQSVIKGAAPAGGGRELRLALAKLKGVEGVCGNLEMGPDQRLRSPMKLFGVRQGQFMSMGSAR
jgi:ABC-type branched-subunit amino acid transport system substrate-binding protein